jgi:hypothetical protein
MLSNKTQSKADRSVTLQRVLRSKYLILGAILFLVYTLAGFLLAPYLIRQNVPKIAEAQLNRVARIGKVRVNPFLFTLEVNKLRLNELDGTPIASFDRLFVDFETTSLFRWAWTFRAVTVEKPKLNIQFNRDGTLNLAQLIPSPEQTETASREAAAGPPPRMVFPNIKIVAGEIDITDRRQSIPAVVRIQPLNMELTEISTLQDRKGPYSLAAATLDGEAFHWTGQIALHPFKSSGRFRFDNIKLGTLWEFIRDRVNLEEPNGLLHFESAYTLDLSGSKPKMTLDGLGLRVNDMSLSLRGMPDPFCNLILAELQAGKFDLDTRKLTIGGLHFGNGRVNLAVDQTGNLNLNGIVRTDPASEGPETKATDASPTTGPATNPDGFLDVRVEALTVDKLAVAYQDVSRTPALSAGIAGLGLSLQIEAQAGGEALQLAVQQLNSKIDGIRLGVAGDDEPVMQIGTLALTDGTFDLGQRRLTLARVNLNDGQIDVVRSAEGQINLIALLMPPEAGAIKSEAQKRDAQGSALQFAIDTIALSQFTTNFSDLSVQPDKALLNLDNLQVTLTQVDGTSPMGVDLALDVRQGGHISVQGTVKPKDPSLETKIDVTAVDLRPLQPYIDTYLALLLHSGTFATQGTLRYGIPKAPSQISYEGGFDLRQLQLTEPQSKETLLGWESLRTSQLKLKLQPDALAIGDLMLSGLAGKFIIHEDGSLNVTRVIKTQAGEPAKPAKATTASTAGKALFPVAIQQLRFEDGGLYFADLTLTPQFGTRIHDLDGFVTGISTAQDHRAQVKMEGQVAEYGTTQIGGEIDMFNPKGFTDIAVVFRNLEMADLTPYSGKFAGRKIETGKLSLDLAYKIKNSQLLGDNKIVVDQLTLGDHVDSSWAVNLPLDLAVAILEDANGIIDIGLPVKGSLEDPEFGIGQLVWKALKNLLTKIVTAPFRALGSLFGGAEADDLEVVAFEPGQSELPPPEIEKLHKLIKALEQRPQLQLIVQGRYSPEVDGHYLKELQIRQQLAAALGMAVAPGEDPGPVAYSDPSAQEQLAAMFRERLGEPALAELMVRLAPPAPKKGQSVPAAEPVDPGRIAKALFTGLVENEPLDDVVLQQLGEARAQAILAVMTADDALPAARVARKTTEALKPGEPIAAKLELGVMGKAS